MYGLPPRGELAMALYLAGSQRPEEEADFGFYHMKKPGRPGVKAAINIHNFAPPSLRSGVLAEMYEHRVNPSGFGAALARDWTDRSSRTVAAAGTPERLLDWFRYARFDLPFIRRFCDVEAMPSRATVWRGVRGDAAAGAAGMCWTPTRLVAAVYAHKSWSEWGQQGGPVLLRREAARDQVLAYFTRQGTGEAVIDGAGSYEVDTADAEEIAALAAEAEPMVAAAEAEAERWAAEVRGMSEDELFQGWEE